jgi:hypothetical protein
MPGSRHDVVGDEERLSRFEKRRPRGDRFGACRCRDLHRPPPEVEGALRVLLVKTHKNGMRAEEIRSALGMQSKEMPRILKQGVASKKLTTKGQKRATTYFAR